MGPLLDELRVVVILLGVTFGGCTASAQYRAGAAKQTITPREPIQMVGYVARDHASEGARGETWTKALAIEDAGGGRFVVVTAELTFLPRGFADATATEIERRTGLERERILLNVSHTHASPAVLGRNPDVTQVYELSNEQLDTIARYTQRVSDAMVDVMAKAIERLQPAVLRYGEGETGFGMNRRVVTEEGVRFGVTPEGPHDPSVPVLAVHDRDGALLATLFGYAAHATTLGSKNYVISGDYPGYAQAAVEDAHPGATALFLMLCAGDQKPEPDGTFELAERHGEDLAAAVETLLRSQMKTLGGGLAATWVETDLAFADYDRKSFEPLLEDERAFRVRYAKGMLRDLVDGRAPRSYSYPVQAVRLGDDLTLLAMGGEVVVDYALQIKREFPKEQLMVAAYSNDVMAYIPTLRVLREGGHEGGTSMVPYNQPAAWAADVEERVMQAVGAALAGVGVERVRR